MRTLEGIDIDQLEIGSYDGGKLEPVYQPTTDPKTLEADIAKGKYHGSCHCGKVTLELNSKPLNELEASEDNCSICTRVCLTLSF